MYDRIDCDQISAGLLIERVELAAAGEQPPIDGVDASVGDGGNGRDVADGVEHPARRERGDVGRRDRVLAVGFVGVVQVAAPDRPLAGGRMRFGLLAAIGGESGKECD